MNKLISTEWSCFSVRWDIFSSVRRRKSQTQKKIAEEKKCSFTLSQLSQSLWTSAKCSPHSLWNEKLSSFYFDELAMNEKERKKERRTKLNCGGGRPTRAEKSFKFRFPLLMINRLRTPNNSRKPPSNFRNTSSSSTATQIKSEVKTESFFRRFNVPQNRFLAAVLIFFS